MALPYETSMPDPNLARILTTAANRLAEHGAFPRAHWVANRAQAHGADLSLPQVAVYKWHIVEHRYEQALRVAVPFLNANERDTEMRKATFQTMMYPKVAQSLLPIMEKVLPTGPSPIVLAGLYLLGCESCRRPPRLDLTTPLVWTSALQWLFEDREPELLTSIAARLATRIQGGYFDELRGLLRVVPRPVPHHGFIDRLDDAVQLVPAMSAHADTLLVCFCGFNGRLGMPLNLFHRWMSRLPAHVIYLRDHSDLYYRNGIPDLGPDWGALIEALAELARTLGTPRIATYGSSMGGFVAVRAGIELGARRIVSVGGRMEYDNTGKLDPHSEDKAMARQAAAAEIRDLLAMATAQPEIACIYGESIEVDVADAAVLSDIPAVRRIGLPDQRRHNTVPDMAISGDLRRLLDWLVGSSDELRLTGTV